ncbi:MAG: hypothetical protein R3F61_00615 [Myxococcota bacterium]
MELEGRPEWDHVHPIVGHLLRDHGLGPDGLRGFPTLAQLDMVGSARVGMWMAREGRPYVDPEDLPLYDADLAAARRHLDAVLASLAPGAPPEVVRHKKATLAEVRAIAARKRPAGVEGLAAAAASCLAVASYSILQVLQAMAVRLGKAVEPDAVPALAVRLEDAILRAECQAAADTYVAPPVVVTHVIWRGPRGSKAAGHFLFRTTTGFGAVTKLKNRWSGVSGGRDEVLATLPEAWFPDALAAFFTERASPPAP